MLLGRWLVIGGITLAIIGGIIWLLGKAGIVSLPGTLRIQTSGITCIIPILASLVLSIVLTIVLNLIARFFNR